MPASAVTAAGAAPRKETEDPGASSKVHWRRKTHMNEAAAAIDADKQRAQTGGGPSPAANYNFLATSAFRFLPASCASRPIRGTRSLGHDAFKIEIACGLKHCISRLRQMLDVLDVLDMRALAAQQLLSRILRSVGGRCRRSAKIPALCSAKTRGKTPPL